jgi:hypothetical protein
MSDGKRTVEQIVTGTTKNYGKQLCMHCVSKMLHKKKEAVENAAATVSK